MLSTGKIEPLTHIEKLKKKNSKASANSCSQGRSDISGTIGESTMKSRSSLIKEQPRNTGVRINKPYMGSFCQSQEGIMKESNSNDISSINKNFKTPIRQSKISINLTKTEKNAIREPYVTAITLDVLPKESRVSKVDKSNISINNSQLLSSKMTSDPISITKPSPFQSTRKFDNSRVKTSLEIYSKNTKTIKSKL